MDFEEFRNTNGSINLWEAWRSQDCADYAEEDQLSQVHTFLKAIEECQPIMSRQAAAIAIQTANLHCISR